MYLSRVNLTISDSLFDGTFTPALSCPSSISPPTWDCGYRFRDCETTTSSYGLIRIGTNSYGTISNTKIFNGTYAGIYFSSSSVLKLDNVEMRWNGVNYRFGLDNPTGNEVNVYCDYDGYVEIKNPRWSMYTGDYYIYGCTVVNFYELDKYGSTPRSNYSTDYNPILKSAISAGGNSSRAYEQSQNVTLELRFSLFFPSSRIEEVQFFQLKDNQFTNLVGYEWWDYHVTYDNVAIGTFPPSLFKGVSVNNWYVRIAFTANGTVTAYTNYVRINEEVEEEEDISLSPSQIAGITVGVIAFVGVVIGIILVVILIIYVKKKKKGETTSNRRADS